MKNLTPLAVLGTTVLSLTAITERQPVTFPNEPGPIQELEDSVRQMSEVVSSLASVGPGMRPFKLVIPGGTANSAGVGSANPRLVIDSDGGDGTFVVNSILLKTNITPTTGFYAFSLNWIEVDGARFSTRTYNLFTGKGSGVEESADMLGAPISIGTSFAGGDTGGCVPQELIADAAGPKDIEVQFFARADTGDLDILEVQVTGYKLPGHNISVSYVPGN